MLKKITLFLALFILLSVLPKYAAASHVSGGEVTYKSLGGNDFKVTLVLYWDCSAFDPGTTAQMSTTNSCGMTDLNFTVNLDTAYEISQLCPTSLLNSTCNGGTLPGNKKNVYSAIVTLPGQCNYWTFEHTSCCRNNSTNVPANPSYTFYATLNNLDAPLNNSPYFTSQPLPYLCVGQTVCYSPGVVEIDGNTLGFDFVSAMNTDAVTPVVYAGGFSGTSPMAGITILPANGLIQFTPTAIGNYVVTFMVTERNAAGVVIGTVIRDIEMVVVNCSNQVVPCSSGPITAIGGFGATIIPPNTVQVCENVPFSFSFSFTDPDPADILTIITNLTQVLPGAVFNTTGTNPITVNVAWNAPVGTANTFTTFAVTVSDNACPVTGQQTVNYIMDILPATYAGPDVTICGNQADTLHGQGPGNVFTWSVLSGPPMVLSGIGQNFSCFNCQNPIATPTATTTYLLTCSGGAGCVLTDTVTVFVVPDFNYNVTQSSPNSCLLDPVQLNVVGVTPGPASAYTYLWTPAAHLNNPNIANPIASFISPGTYNYDLTITSPQGCVKNNTLSVVVAPAFAPQITASHDTSFCAGTVTLNAPFSGSNVPAVCGISPTGGCNGAALTGIVGSGQAANTANTTTGYPAPFGNFYTTVREQFLYTAAELNAAGITGGKIDQLDWNVSAIAGITTYHEYTINMGCTNLTTFNSSNPVFASGLFNVFPAATINIATGWNSMIFTNAYEWDGISNIIVEVCFNELNPGSNWTDNSSTYFTNTTYTSSIWSLSDSQDQCGNSTGFVQSGLQHPDMRLHYCSIVPIPSDFTYHWVAYPPSGNIANDTLQFTTGQPTSITDYVVTVTNISGGCHSSDTVHVDLINIASMHITPAGPYCTASNRDTLQVSVPIGTGVFSGPGIVDNILGVFDPSQANLGANTIHYTVSSGFCGIGDTSIVLNVLSSLDPTITAVPPICSSSNPITLSAATAGGSWSGAGITDTINGVFNPGLIGLVGNNTITYTIYTPCYSRDTVIINVVQQLDATIDPPGGPYCVGSLDAPIVQLTSASSAGATGAWSGQGIVDPIAGTFNPHIAGPGVHTISHFLSAFCGDTATTTITVIASPIVSFTPDITAGCAPVTVNYTSVTDQPGGNYNWNFGNGFTDITANPTATYTSYNNGVAYNVSLIYTNSTGCSDTVVQNGLISIYSQPVAVFSSTPQPTNITQPQITFIDQSTGVINTWNWTFGTADGSTLQSPTYVYADTGTYHVQLIVINNNGCVDTARGTVTIDPILTCYIPSGFTPDGNGNNDEFRVHGTDIQHDGFEMSIFDRWGERLFYTENMTEGWNGRKFNLGDILEEGAYVYKIRLKDYKGLEHEYIGHVTIIK